MTVMNNMLTETAKAIAGESYSVMSHLAFSTDTSFAIAVSDSAISGESGDRIALSDSRSVATVTFNGTRTGALVASSDGETLTGAGTLSASSGGTLFSEILLPSLLHTTSFDIEVDWAFTVQRRGGS